MVHRARTAPLNSLCRQVSGNLRVITGWQRSRWRPPRSRSSETSPRSRTSSTVRSGHRLQQRPSPKKQVPRCSFHPLTCLQVQVLPRQWMVRPSSDSRLRLGERPAWARIQIKFSKSSNEVRRCEPLIFAVRGTLVTPCPADWRWAIGGLDPLGGRNRHRSAASEMVSPAAHKADEARWDQLRSSPMA